MQPELPTRGLVDRLAKEAREERELAPYATHSATSRGRHHPESEDEFRTVFERDRDRIVHSTAFRRLMYKTQVFINREGDHNRTRLSHSLEVAQVARSLAAALALNEGLVESLALAHDIGHPPFGHRGEVALDEILREHGGFRHNAQVLRVVDLLERRSPAYPGLNLSREVRESLLKHESRADWPEEFAPRPRHPCLEAQVVDLADSTAYQMHDLEDGLLAGMFTEECVREESGLWRRAEADVEERHPGFLQKSDDVKLRVKRVANQLLGACIRDLIEATRARLAVIAPRSPPEVKSCDRALVGHGDEIGLLVAELQAFLYRRFYRHERLLEFSAYARAVLARLFDAYRSDPSRMSPWYRSWAKEVGLERAVCDYLAGMTDRFAESEHRKY